MKTFSQRIISWYHHYKRDLPWRHTKDPFKIWLSEIILQQTRVNQGLNYYLAFTNKYKNIESLARAPEEEVLKLWQGLGYYSRARNLHQAAKQVVSEFNGKFPDDYPLILSLKGIGDYTASAIASIAFNQAYPVLDGNVYRVMSRFLMIADPVNSTNARKKIKDILHSLIDNNDPGTFNQAIMELGALVCTPSIPQCVQCPVHNQCKAFQHNKTTEYPVKSKKEKPLNRYFHYLVILTSQDNILNTILYQRNDKDIWAGLFEFPLIENECQLTEEELINHPEFPEITGSSFFKVIDYSEIFVHKLTHRHINARFLTLTLDESSLLIVNKSFISVHLNNLFKYPVSRLTEKFISNNHIFNVL